MGNEVRLIRSSRFARFTRAELNSDWRNINYSAIDVETTGLALKEDEIISIGVAHIHAGRVKTENNFYREIRPKRLPSPESIRIHNLRGIDLMETAPIESVFPDLVAQVDGKVLIAHAAWVEYAFLKRHLRRTNVTFSKQMIDTAALARAAGYAADVSGIEPSLEFLARRIHLPVYAPHNALGDALTTAVVFLALATELEREQLAQGASGLTLRKLLEISAENAKG